MHVFGPLYFESIDIYFISSAPHTYIIRPRSCKNTAIKECESIVKDKSSYPKNCDAPGSSTRNKLAEFCEPEVEAYLSGPAPSPPSPVPSAWKQCDKISHRGDCRDCCKEAEDKKDQVCACQNYAGCPRDSCKK